MASEPVTGFWEVETTTQFQFSLALTQADNSIFGTMARSNGFAPVNKEPVDVVGGSLTSDGKVEFTRARLFEFVQVYTGQITGFGDSRSIAGTFTHNGQTTPPNGGAWTATFVPTGALSFGFVSGDMAANKNQFLFNLALARTANLITGTMTRTNGVEPVDFVSGSVTEGAGAEVHFTRIRQAVFVQQYAGRYTNIAPGNERQLIMQGTFTHQAVDPTNFSTGTWFATLAPMF